MQIRKAIIPAAGTGTRMLPATSVIYKELFTILNRPIIDYIIKEIIEAGIEEILIIISKEKEDIKNYIVANENRFCKTKFQFIYQDKPIGLGDAVNQAKEYIQEGEFFLILLPDNIIVTYDSTNISQSLINIYAKKDCSLISVESVSQNEIHLRGALEVEKTKDNNILLIKQIIEKPSKEKTPSFYTVAGRYLLNSSIFKFIEDSDMDENGEIQITSAIQKYLKSEKMLGYIFDGNRYDTGSAFGYAKAFTAICLSNDEINTEYKKWLNEIITK